MAIPWSAGVILGKTRDVSRGASLVAPLIRIRAFVVRRSPICPIFLTPGVEPRSSLSIQHMKWRLHIRLFPDLRKAVRFLKRFILKRRYDYRLASTNGAVVILLQRGAGSVEFHHPIGNW